MTDGVDLDITADNIAVVTFNRPHARNALDLTAMRRFASIVTELAARAEPVRGIPRDAFATHTGRIRGVILTGAGRDAFCSGGDLLDLSGRPTEDDAREFTAIMGGALSRLERLPVPVIAAVNGYALGGGSEIAAACDLRIVDEAAQMGFIHIRMALIPGWGAGQRLLRCVGYSRALAILLEGRPMGADELLSHGLAHQIAPRGRAADTAMSLALKIAQHPAETIAAIKRMLWAGLTEQYDAALATEGALFPPLWASEPHNRAVEAFLNRR
jgi:enoyl-CoA hydratase